MSNESYQRVGGWHWTSVAPPLSSFYFFYFAFLGCLLPFWPIFLKDLGVSGYYIGLVQAVFLSTKIFAPSLAGFISDTTGLRIRLIRFGVVAAGMCFALFLLDFSLVQLLLYSCLYSLFWNAILSQFEAYTLDSLGSKASKYSRIRMWGSLGFIALSLGLGWLFEFTSIEWLPLIMLGMIFLAALVSFSLPELVVTSSDAAKTSVASIIPLLRKREIQAFLLICLLMQVSHGPYYSFFSLYMKEYGYSTSFVGGLWALGVMAEVVLFLIFPSWVKRVGAYFLLKLSILLSVLRWWLIAGLPENELVISLAQLLHAFSFGCLHVVSMMYVQRFFSKEFSGRGQALYSGVSFGLGGALGALFSGFLWEGFEHSLLYVLAGVAALCSMLVVSYLDIFDLDIKKAAS